MSKLPHQTYRPTNFTLEVKKLNDTCEHIYINGKWRLQDNEGNIYTIDFEDYTITIE